VAGAFPDLKIVLAHGGRGWWYGRCRLHQPDAAQRVDRAGGAAAEEAAAVLPQLRPRPAGAEVIFATDWPGVPGIARNAAAVADLGFDRDTLELIFWRNAFSSTPWENPPPPGSKLRVMTRPGRDVAPNMTDYEAERAAFRLDVPPRFKLRLDVLEKRAAATPDGLALLALGADGAETARYTWAEMARESRRMGNALLGRGEEGRPPLRHAPPASRSGTSRPSAPSASAPSSNAPAPSADGEDIEYRIARAEAVGAITRLRGRGQGRLGGGQPADAAAQDRRRRVAEQRLDTARPPRRDGLSRSHARRSTAATDPMLLYFTSGTVSYPRWSCTPRPATGSATCESGRAP